MGMPFTIDDGVGDGLELESNRATTLPISREELRELAPLVVHFKCATSNRVLVQRISELAHAALHGARVDGHQLCVVVTDETVEMSAANIQQFASYIVPTVLRTLGLPPAS